MESGQQKQQNNQQPPFEEDKFSTTDESGFSMIETGKEVRLLTNIELIRRAEEAAESLQLEQAVVLYEEGTQRFPNDTVILDGYSDILIQLGEHEKAKQYLERSILLNPNKDGHKYLNFAETLTGAEAVQMYRKGIQIIQQQDMPVMKATGQADEYKLANKQCASALASIAEAFMSDPLCDDPSAEVECEKSLDQALKLDDKNIDALQTLANLRLIRAKDEEARACIRRAVKVILEDQQNLPPIEFRMTTSRLLVELQVFKDAVKILDTIVSENDENPEAWYLLAFSYFNLKKYQNARECCKNVKTMVIKLKILHDDELKAGYDELWAAILKALGKTPEQEANEDEQMQDGGEDEDDDYATVSEEDISDEDAEMKD